MWQLRPPVTGDVNGDGFSDFIARGLILNQGGSNFIRVNYYYSETLSLADFNGDGALDLFLRRGGTGYSIWTNATPPRPSPRPPEFASAQTLPPRMAEFAWTQPVAGAGYTYNIRLGTTPGGVEIVSPHSDPLTGYRRVVEMGNAGPSGLYRISDLPPGTYFWAVQSVDQAHRGSPFTPEQVFVHSTVPLPSDLQVTNVTLNSALVLWGDYDLDGFIDLVTPAFAGSHSIFGLKNIGAGQFVRTSWTYPFITHSNPYWFDSNADGDLDILFFSFGGDTFGILENKQAIPPKPAAPGSLASVVRGTGVRLSWNPPSDLPTPERESVPFPEEH